MLVEGDKKKQDRWSNIRNKKMVSLQHFQVVSPHILTR